MHRSEKERLVAELTERLKGTDTLIVADYRGLSVTEIDDLRTKLLEHGARFSIVKNTLTKRAAESAGVEPLMALLEGPTAIAFLESDGDPVAVAKALDDASKAEVLVIKGGLLDGAEIAAEDVKRLAKLPPAEALKAQLVSALAGPLTMVVGLFNAPLRDLVGVLDARIRQLEEQAPAAEPPVRDSGPGEGAPGEPGGSPADEGGDAPEPAQEEQPEAEAGQPEPGADAPVRDSGPGEGAPGEPGGSPADEGGDVPEPAQEEQPQPEAEAELESQPEETQEGEEQ
jgi:large subunit ribosomal protein L10